MECPICEVEVEVKHGFLAPHDREVWGDWCGPERPPRECRGSGMSVAAIEYMFDEDEDE